jgi:hypothetical protein
MLAPLRFVFNAILHDRSHMAPCAAGGIKDDFTCLRAKHVDRVPLI